jgi:hypothetical protein
VEVGDPQEDEEAELREETEENVLLLLAGQG